MVSSSQGGVVRETYRAAPLARRRWAGVVVVCIGVMMVFVNMSSTLPALSFIQEDLHISGSTLVWVPSAFTLAMVSLLMSAGTFGELYGRRRTYFTGIAFFLLGSLIAFLAGNAGVLITGQAVMGVGAAAALPSGLSIVSNLFSDQHERVRAISLWASTAGIGLAIGPLVAGALLDSSSWHSVYLTNVALGLVALCLIPVFITEGKHPTRQLDLLGVVIGTITIAAIAFAIIEGGANGYTTAPSVAAYVVIAAGLALFAVVELKHPDPMLDLRLFRSVSFAAIQLVAASVMFGFVGLALLTVLYLQRVAHLDAWSAGVHLLPMTLGYVVVSAVAARVVRSVGFTATLTVGLMVMGSGALAMLRVGSIDGYGAMWPALLGLGVGSALLVAPSTAAAVNSVSPLQVGMASATVNMFRQFGSMLGASVLGTIATTQFPKHLTSKLTDAGVDPDTTQSIVSAVSRGSTPEVTDSLAPVIADVVPDAFTRGLHVGFLIGGVVLLVMAIPAALFIRHRHPALLNPRPEREGQQP